MEAILGSSARRTGSHLLAGGGRLGRQHPRLDHVGAGQRAARRRRRRAARLMAVVPFWSAYIQSLSSAIFFIVGSTDGSLYTELEKIYSAFMMFVGTAVSAFIVSQLSMYLAQMNASQREYRAKMDMVHITMRKMALPASCARASSSTTTTCGPPTAASTCRISSSRTYPRRSRRRSTSTCTARWCARCPSSRSARPPSSRWWSTASSPKCTWRATLCCGRATRGTRSTSSRAASAASSSPSPTARSRSGASRR